MAVTMFQKRAASNRRTADITRLSEQYKRNVSAVTGEYERAFGAYQQNVRETMAPYEASIQKYQKEIYPAYEQAAAAYQARLASYQDTLADVIKEPYTDVNVGKIVQVLRRAGYDEGRFVVEDPSGKRSLWATESAVAYSREQAIQNDTKFYRVGSNVFEIKKKEVPAQFTEAPPEAPTAPTAPDIADFDSAPFEQRRAQLQSELNRELGERRSAKLAAVSRRGTRPLLQGA